MFWAWFLAIILSVGGLVLVILGANDDSEAAGKSCLGVILALLGVVMIIALLGDGDREPNALDVYRGRTELQITYRDTIPIDTVVVWKAEFDKSKNKGE